MKDSILLIGLCSLLYSLAAHADDFRGIRIAIKDVKGQDVGYYTGSHALVIGVSRYKKGWPVLESVPSEVDKVASVLKMRGFQVTQVLDPNSKALEHAFEEFIDAYGYDPGNRLLFYFAGHGYTLQRRYWIRGCDYDAM